jgi:hypothetical protein
MSKEMRNMINNFKKLLIEAENKKLINETQTLDFKGDKSIILNFIKSVKKGETGQIGLLEKTIYGIIRNSGVGKNVLNSANNIGFTDENKKNWTEIFKKSPFVYEGGWSQINFNPNLKKKSGNKTFNFYLTFEKNKENIVNFAKGINNLNKELNKFSNEKQTPISWKTHNNLDYMVKDNDSFKLYYYDEDIKKEVVDLVKKWLSDNNIKVSTRTHEHGVDADMGKGKQSYGEILSEKVVEEFIKVIKQNGDKYTDEQYYQWLATYTPSILSQMNQK